MYKKLKLVESAKLTESDGWIAFYNGKKIEITKDEADDLWGAKQVAIKKLNVPKSKTSQLAVEPAYNESAKLTEAQEDELKDKVEDLENTIDANKDLEDTINSEEQQEENPVEEETELETKLDELRDILVDLDLNLYRVASKENPNNVIYIIGKVAEESTDTLMLVDNKPEEVNQEEIETPIIDDVKLDEPKEEIETFNDEDKKSELESRFDFIVLPKTFDEINKLNPRYGDEITPDHESIVEYLMNCLIEVNPDAAEELQNKDLEVAEEIPAEPIDDLELDIGLEGEEEEDEE